MGMILKKQKEKNNNEKERGNVFKVHEKVKRKATANEHFVETA